MTHPIFIEGILKQCPSRETASKREKSSLPSPSVSRLQIINHSICIRVYAASFYDLCGLRNALGCLGASCMHQGDAECFASPRHILCRPVSLIIIYIYIILYNEISHS